MDYEILWRTFLSLLETYQQARVRALSPTPLVEIMQLMELNQHLEEQNNALRRDTPPTEHH